MHGVFILLYYYFKKPLINWMTGKILLIVAMIFFSNIISIVIILNVTVE